MKEEQARKGWILLFEASLTPQHRRAYDGVYRYAAEKGWNVQPIEYSIAASKRRHEREPVMPDIPKLLNLWKPDGAIIECGGREPIFDLKAFGRVPYVLIHSGDCASGGRVIEVDNREIAATAARELLRLGLSDYAYVPYFGNPAWSVRRQDEFKSLIQVAGRRYHQVNTVCGDESVFALMRALQTLPKPCGIMAANDEIGSQVISACQMSDIGVPEDVAVVGVDNDVSICENASVTLSSVAIDHALGGYRAAAALSLLMHRKCARAAFPRSPVTALVRRASTNLFQLKAVAKSVERIRKAHGLNLTPSDIASGMNCTRRLADMRFKAELGVSVFEEIRRVRIDYVKSRLADSRLGLDAIAGECGYRTTAELCRDFRKATGQTPGKWRKGR